MFTFCLGIWVCHRLFTFTFLGVWICHWLFMFTFCLDLSFAFYVHILFRYLGLSLVIYVHIFRCLDLSLVIYVHILFRFVICFLYSHFV